MEVMRRMISINDTDKEMLLLASESIRLYCKGTICSDCIFENNDENCCILKSSVTAEWRLNNDEDN